MVRLFAIGVSHKMNQDKPIMFVTYADQVTCEECKNWNGETRWCKRLSHSITRQEAQKLIKCKHYLESKGSK